MTKNANLPAMPVEAAQLYESRCDNGSWELASLGLTKLELFCLHHGVPETGDPDLDSIIRKGNHKKAAMMAMQGLCANSIAGSHHLPENIAMEAVAAADALLAELEK